MNINTDKFDNAYRARFKPLSLPVLQAQHRLLGRMSGDTRIIDRRWGAYMLATVKHECADTWAPVYEAGRGQGHDYGTPDAETGQTYYGRGYVQITHKDNYRRIGNAIGIDLVTMPGQALEVDVAYEIMALGMIKGLFTGRKLVDYLNTARSDYMGARAIINGQDRAQMIAGYADLFDQILKFSSLG